MRIVFALLLAIVLLIAPSSGVRAATPPEFPSCANPTGELKVRYDSGSHAIVGQSGLKEGKDEVYWLGDGNALQCLCPNHGSGTQTNWWKFTGLSDAEINSYKIKGWHFVPSGRDWGLDAGPYLAQNVDFSCGNGGENQGVGGGLSESVLALATTGDNSKFVGFLGLGVALFVGGLMLRKR